MPGFWPTPSPGTFAPSREPARPSAAARPAPGDRRKPRRFAAAATWIRSCFRPRSETAPTIGQAGRRRTMSTHCARHQQARTRGVRRPPSRREPDPAHRVRGGDHRERVRGPGAVRSEPEGCRAPAASHTPDCADDEPLLDEPTVIRPPDPAKLAATRIDGPALVPPRPARRTEFHAPSPKPAVRLAASTAAGSLRAEPRREPPAAVQRLPPPLPVPVLKRPQPPPLPPAAALEPHAPPPLPAAASHRPLQPRRSGEGGDDAATPWHRRNPRASAPATCNSPARSDSSQTPGGCAPSKPESSPSRPRR